MEEQSDSRRRATAKRMGLQLRDPGCITRERPVSRAAPTLSATAAARVSKRDDG